MNNEIQRFDFKGAALRTLTDEEGEPWFVAKDVCAVLELNNVSQALTRLDGDEKSSITLNDGTPGSPNKSIVSESGLYALVLASRKPEAHEFKRWVTHDSSPNCSARTSEMRDDTEFRRGPGGSPNAARHYTRKGGA